MASIHPVLQIYRCANWRREQRSMHAGHAKEITFSHTLHPLSLPRPAGKAAPGNQPRTLGTRTKPHTRRRTRMAAGVRNSEDPRAQAQLAALRPIQASRPVGIDASARVDG